MTSLSRVTVMSGHGPELGNTGNRNQIGDRRGLAKQFRCSTSEMIRDMEAELAGKCAIWTSKAALRWEASVTFPDIGILA